MQASNDFGCRVTMLVALLALLTAPLPGLAVVFPDTAAIPDVAGDCLLRMFNQTKPRDRKVCKQRQLKSQ
jgi:hypothetical protein